jgi:hypothetical protein
MQKFISTADKGMTFAIVGALLGVMLFFPILAVAKGERLSGGILVFPLLATGVLAFAAMYYVDTAQLLVDDMGLGREICGSVCMQIPWTGIKSIRQIFRPTVRNGPQIIIQVIPHFRRGMLLRLRRALVISEQFEQFDELLAIFNARISEYAIQVETNSNGLWRRCSELVAAKDT